MSELQRAELEVLKLDLKIKKVLFQILNWVLGTLRGKHPEVKFFVPICIVGFAVVFGLIVKFAA